MRHCLLDFSRTIFVVLSLPSKSRMAFAPFVEKIFEEHANKQKERFTKHRQCLPKGMNREKEICCLELKILFDYERYYKCSMNANKLVACQ